MGSMMPTSTATLASTAPTRGSSSPLTRPSVIAPIRVPASEPTPANTTTVKLSMM